MVDRQFEILSQMICDKTINIRSTLDPSIERIVGYANSFYAYRLLDGRGIVMISDVRGTVEKVEDIKYVLIQVRKNKEMKWLCNGQPSLNCRVLYQKQ